MPFGALQPAVPTWFRRSRSTAARRQLRRPCAVAHGAQHRRVCELSFRIHAPKHESAAAHVSATDKLSRKKELIAKDREQYIDVLRTSDAAQQHRLAIGTERPSKRLGVSLQRCAE